MSEIQEYIRAYRAHEIFDISKTTFWRLSKEDDFPKKRKVHGATLYSILELREWFDSKVEAA